MIYDMTLRRAKRRKISQPGSFVHSPHRKLDPQQKAIRRFCACYLQRLLSHFPILSRETLDFLVCLVDAPKIETLNRFLLRHVSPEQREHFQSAMEECRLSPERWPDVMDVALSWLGRPTERAFRQVVETQLEKQKRTLSSRKLSDFERRGQMIQKMFALSDQERDFLILMFICTTWRPAQSFFVEHLQCQLYANRHYLQVMLDMSAKELNAILQGPLQRMGAIQMESAWFCLEDTFMGLFQRPDADRIESDYFERLPSASIELEQFLVDTEKIDHLIQLLAKRPNQATHILLVGPTGTGKSSFARALAAQLGIPAYSIVSSESNTTNKRRAAIQACMNLTNQGEGSLIIVDEADNLLNTHLSWFERGETQDKGWLNQLLEQDGIRMIWIANSIHGLDASVRRRFAYSVIFQKFNRSQRIKIWESVLKANKMTRAFTAGDIKGLATRYDCSAGTIDLAVKKARAIANPGTSRFKRAVRLSLEANRTLECGGECSPDHNEIESKYSVDALNISSDGPLLQRTLETFKERLREGKNDGIRNLNLLFHGPPGTGKSEFARYLAHRLGQEIQFCQAGELLSPFVGETERQIFEAFRSAERDEAVFVIDEADTFLFPRAQAHRSWEISFTNAFLTGMERYRGILVCTTNRLQGLDEAALRRFQIKVGFDWLTPDGAMILYNQLLAPLTRKRMDQFTETALRSLKGLAPGDFRAVRDRLVLHPPDQNQPQDFLMALKEEIAVKELHCQTSRKIGFN